MGYTLQVENLPTGTGEAELKRLFSRLGTVQSVQLIRVEKSARSGKSATVEMASAADARSAIAELHNLPLGGRILTVTRVPAPERVEHDLLKAMRRTPALIGGELAGPKRRASTKRRTPGQPLSRRRRRTG